MDGAPPLETVLDICGHKHRRIVLAVLANQRQPIPMSDLTDAIIKYNHHLPPAEIEDESVKRIHVGLHQIHLPKLAEAGFVQYDSERKVVESTANVGEKGSHLSGILAMDSELPAA